MAFRSTLKASEKLLAEILPPRVFFALQDRVRPILDRRVAASGRNVRRIDSIYEVQWPNGDRIAFPHPRRYCRYMFSSGLERVLGEMLSKYQDGDVEVESGDVLFEVGANVGEFTLAASRKGARVVAAEPDPLAFNCLRRNVPSATAEPIAIGDQEGEAMLYLGTSGADSSLLRSGGTQPTRVEVLTIASWMARHGTAQIDFLKVEAEGFEPEVIAGAAPVLDKIRKIAIDCGPERYGKTTFSQCEELLKGRFRLWRKANVLFALAN